MILRNWSSATLALVAVIVASTVSKSKASEIDGLSALDGEWIYVEDRTIDQPLERQGPPMASKFSLGVKEGAIILNGHGSGHRDVRVAIDGTVTEIAEQNRTVKYQGDWKDETFQYEVTFERAPDSPASGIQLIRRTFRLTSEGLIVTSQINPPTATEAIGLYRHPDDIAMPQATSAAINDLAWLAGTWLGKRSSGASIEERWSPPLGGAMLAVSRSVNTSGKMFAFEYLRVVERDGGLVYIAQPGGKAATEFTLTELTSTRAVFDNPRHDYPKRIVYELADDGTLSATIGFMKGGTPQRYEYKKEAQEAPHF